MGSMMGGGTTKSSNSQEQDTSQHTTADSTTNSSTNSDQTQSANQYGNTAGNTSSQQDPWALSIPYLLQGLQGANKAYNDPSQQSYYTGGLYAQMTPDQQLALRALTLNSQNGVGGQLTNVMQDYGTKGLANLGDATAVANNLYNRAQLDPTSMNIADAQSYANNPWTQGMIKAAQAPIEQQLREAAIPGLNTTASGTGNMDSSRAGVMEALLRRSAGSQEADVASNILGSQYDKGLQLAESGRMNNMNSMQSTLGQLGDLGRTGVGLANQGYQDSMNNYNVPLTSDNLNQQDMQKKLDEAYQQWQGQTAQPWQNLNNYWNIASKPLGSSTTGTTLGTTNQSSNALSNANSTSTSNTQSIQDMIAHMTGTSQSSTTQPGPGILGGLMGIASGVGSFFSPGGIASSIGGFFK